MSHLFRKKLFLTYERPNWLIFDDAYPQLLIYEKSKEQGEPLFYLLKAFGVSVFAEAEWEFFWRTGERSRLCTSQIINEQNVIEKPVIENPYFHGKVFDGVLFRLQEWLHMNAVVFPTTKGGLYGYSVYRFCHLGKRIEMGKRLAWLLFQSLERDDIQRFAINVEHTGSRADYEHFTKSKSVADSRPLRRIYQPVKHKRMVTSDWFLTHTSVKPHWFQPPSIPSYNITNWYRRKQRQTDLLGKSAVIFCRK